MEPEQDNGAEAYVAPAMVEMGDFTDVTLGGYGAMGEGWFWTRNPSK